jgi:hypothetical protein
MCDDLIEELNAKCLENMGNRAIVAPLIETLNMLNGGQGLGFRVFGVVIDKKMLFRIGSTVVGLLATALPIVFGFRQDLNEEYAQNSTDVNTAQWQLQLVMHEQLAALNQQLAVQQQQLADLAMLVNGTC